MFYVNLFILLYMLVGCVKALIGWTDADDATINPIIESYAKGHNEFAWRMYIIFLDVILPWPLAVIKYGWW